MWSSGSGRGDAGGFAGGGEDLVDLSVAVGDREEPGLVGAWGQVDAAVEHGVEEAGVGGGVLLDGAAVVEDLVPGEEDAEESAGALHPGRQPGVVEGSLEAAAEDAGEPVEMGVGDIIEQGEGGETRRGRQRVP